MVVVSDLQTGEGSTTNLSEGSTQPNLMHVHMSYWQPGLRVSISTVGGSKGPQYIRQARDWYFEMIALKAQRENLLGAC